MNTRIRALIDLGFAFERDILDYREGETPVPVWPFPGPQPSLAEIDARIGEPDDRDAERSSTS